MKEDRTSMEMLDTEENREYYGGIKMASDYNNELFLSTGGILSTKIDIDMEQNGDITMHSKITNCTYLKQDDAPDLLHTEATKFGSR